MTELIETQKSSQARLSFESSRFREQRKPLRALLLRRGTFDKEKWLVSREFDLLFVCGLAPWILGALLFFTIENQSALTGFLPAMTVFYVAAAILIGEAHQFTSILRYYTELRSRRRLYRRHRIPLWVIYAIVSIFILAAKPLISFSGSGWLMTAATVIAGITIVAAIAVFPVVLVQHVCAQAKAIGLTYCKINSFELSVEELRGLSVFTWVLVAAGACNIALPFKPLLGPLSLLDNEFLRNWLAAMTVLCAVVIAASFIGRGLKHDEWLPGSTAILWTSLLLFVLVPSQAMAYIWVFVPIFFHATQHWAVAWSTRQTELAERTESTSLKRSKLKDLFMLVLPVQAVTLAILFLPLLFNQIPVASTTQGIDLTLGVHLSMVIFYLHYFCDRVVWRNQKEVIAK